jgi:hypothetical protein
VLREKRYQRTDWRIGWIVGVVLFFLVKRWLCNGSVREERERDKRARERLEELNREIWSPDGGGFVHICGFDAFLPSVFGFHLLHNPSLKKSSLFKSLSRKKSFGKEKRGRRREGDASRFKFSV